MGLFTKTVFAFVPALILAGGSAQAATENWRHSCVGPEVACSSSQAAPAAKKAAMAPAKQKTATKVNAKKSASTASGSTVSKSKTAKKIAKAQDDDAAPVKVKKAKKIAKAQDDDEAPVAKPKKKAKVAAKKNSDDGDSGGKSYQSGVASWYGGYFHGRTTANGEKYDMWAMTAAHKTLPFGTRVKVTNTSNGDSTIVRINDRGPFVAGRVIDLSKAAANDIGMGGLAKVKLTVLSKG